jgi:hypothetical protein
MRIRFGVSRFCFAVAALSIALAPPGVAAQPLPQSGEFLINTYTSLNQTSPVIAFDGQGGFVVVWEQQDAGSMPDDIVARRFDSSGNGLGADFQVNTYITGLQRSPAVTRTASGDFVVVWSSLNQDGSVYGVFGRRFDSGGNPLAQEFQVNSYTPGAQTLPRIATAAGGFVVVWQSYEQDGDNNGVFGRRLDPSGNPLAAEFQVNVFTTDDQQAVSVTSRSDGSFIVAWGSDTQDGSSTGVFARRFASTGVAIGGELQLNTYTTNIQTGPSLAYDASGGFVAVWPSQQDGSGFGVFGRRFNGSAAPLGDEFQINSYTTSNQFAPGVVRLGSGAFVVVWSSYGQDGSNYGVFARAFNSDGQPRGDELQLNTTFTSSQFVGRAAASGQQFVVVWQSALQDGSQNAVIGRRYLMPLTLDVDGDGQFLPLTDALLILRYAFGFRGNTLISNAVGMGCTRCDAPSIEAYLGSI